MACTRGGSFLHRGENFLEGERWRPTASARRRHGAVDSDVHIEDAVEDHAVEDHAFEEHDIEQEEDHQDVVEGGFPEGPLDTSVLTHYEREEIKLISHGKKLNKLGSSHEGIKDIVNGSGLLLTVILDDVSSLLHFPVLGKLCHLEELDFEESRRAIVEFLGVDDGRAGVELHAAHGAKRKIATSAPTALSANSGAQRQLFWEFGRSALRFQRSGRNFRILPPLSPEFHRSALWALSPKFHRSALWALSPKY
ncbi:hypothetical protein LR48_Vigan01g050900 [Vigna angularis]|uniref:Uncharacterized protein n=1 Tax=Phaseolus angularis TaxID=3914 RepID=A0A0L9TLE8_PHAAN|nr:hypothetical protein LR48_Vigan01g050900 [Vigna angularis]